MKKLITAIKNTIKRVVTTAPVKDTGDYPIVQVKYFNRTAFIELLMPYGISSSPPVGSLGSSLNVMGQEENRVGIISAGKRRFSNLKEGEVAVGNYVTRARIYFKENGDIDLFTPNNLTGVIEGSMTMSITGEVTINAPLVTINGDVRVSGDLIDNYGSNTNNLGDMRAIYNTHEHPENDSDGPTDQPNEQM